MQVMVTRLVVGLLAAGTALGVQQVCVCSGSQQLCTVSQAPPSDRKPSHHRHLLYNPSDAEPAQV